MTEFPPYPEGSYQDPPVDHLLRFMLSGRRGRRFPSGQERHSWKRKHCVHRYGAKEQCGQRGQLQASACGPRKSGTNPP